LAVKLYTAKQFGDLFHVGPERVYQWIREEKVTSIRTPGGHPRVVYDEDAISEAATKKADGELSVSEEVATA
jgi:hypothetical protein